MPIKYRSMAFKPSTTVAGLINKRTIAKNRLDLDISRISVRTIQQSTVLVFWCIGIFMDAAVIGCQHVFVRMAIIVCGVFSKPLVFWFFGLSWMQLSLDVDMFSCVWLSLYVGYSASYLSSGALGLSWVQLSLDICIWLSLYVGYSASYLSSGALGLSWMKLSLRATCLVPFGFLMDAAIFGCRQGFITWLPLVIDDPFVSTTPANLRFYHSMWAIQQAICHVPFGFLTDAAIIPKYCSMDLEDCLPCIFYSYLQVVSLSVDLQSNVFIGVMADLNPQVLVWVPWTFSQQLNILVIVGSYDSFATVWSALSWPYQLHLRITALAVGS
ncbi:hypothetical protein O0I10_010447 [Lichtheimia ornata]|uniref:Uncharacterized protein n=1 Tax=Lichtheimia ornata TaxID=688661 RepID=A0AAD7UWM1_9FUNG|nr:uncharacterized protein O0I10_010447 [Lichtheimia ornata]KAJ8653880.1 hypothetical protein O0I10_010447 [Lichtheimia ornata]